MGTDIDWSKVGGGGTKPYRQPRRTINTAEQLKAHIRDFDKMGLLDIINKLQAKGFSLTPMYYKELQDNLLKQEEKTGISFSVLAGAEGPGPVLQQALSEGTLGSTRDTRDYAGEQAADDARQAEREEAQRQWEAQQAAEARAYQAEQDRIQREFEAQQAEIERQNRLRLQRLGDLTNLVGQFAGIQQRARETLAGLQGDPFAFAAAKMGVANAGTTPMQSFRGELRGFGAQPLPTIDPNAPLSGIEAQIMGLQGQMAPQAPKIFGMAQGGEVHGQQQTVLVGEAGRPEIVTGTDFKVMPLTGTGAAGYDTSSLLPALSPLYSGLGNMITSHGMTGGAPGYASSFGAGLGQLGYEPRLLRNISSGEIMYNANGTLQPFASTEQFNSYGFNPRDVLNVQANELSGFGQRGGYLGEKPGATGMPDAFGPLSSPIIEPVTGAILPAPFRAAATLNQLRLQNPAFYQLALSAYQNAISRFGDPNASLGYTPESVEAEYRQALPIGQEHGLIGLR